MTNQIKLIETNLKAQIKGKALLPICLYATPGLGKSKTIEAVTKNINAGEYVVSISSINFEAASGIPTFATDSNLDKYSVSGAKGVQSTIWTIPELIMAANRVAEKEGSCVMHLEDFHEMDKTLSAVMYQLLLDRKLGDYKLHEKVAIICSMNHSKEANAGSFHSSAVKSRLNLQPYIFQFDVWYDKFGRFLHPLISSFLSTNQQYCSEQESRTLEASASPRSWSKISDELKEYSDEEIPTMELALLSGVISPNAVQAYEKHVVYFRKLDFKDMVKKEELPDISTMEELDKVILGYIFHSVKTVDNAIYMIDLINHISDQSHSDTVVGFLAKEIVTKYMERENDITISTGQDIVIEKILGSFDVTNYKTTTKNKSKLKSCEIDNQDAVLSIMSQYINH